MFQFNSEFEQDCCDARNISETKTLNPSSRPSIAGLSRTSPDSARINASAERSPLGRTTAVARRTLSVSARAAVPRRHQLRVLLHLP